jgi:hypothetical protein
VAASHSATLQQQIRPQQMHTKLMHINQLLQFHSIRNRYFKELGFFEIRRTDATSQ